MIRRLWKCIKQSVHPIPYVPERDPVWKALKNSVDESVKVAQESQNRAKRNLLEFALLHERLEKERKHGPGH